MAAFYSSTPGNSWNDFVFVIVISILEAERMYRLKVLRRAWWGVGGSKCEYLKGSPINKPQRKSSLQIVKSEHPLLDQIRKPRPSE